MTGPSTPGPWLPASASADRKVEDLRERGYDVRWGGRGRDVTLTVTAPGETAKTHTAATCAACARDAYESAQEHAGQRLKDEVNG
ncbi:hypothetical protein GO986_16370 [Deinococcus sp. HMF7620]|uniref:Uncharacterized protein n=1 Tax=Deinococcus arboris TaxID=2682977 RepID=A0A7C9M3I9_9DEIO|nr:hypothetical protein [Deinococcus arboris]MVN88322.1 hypothetical protein [Deinococcus arboris]